MKTLKIACQGAASVNIDDLIEFQGDLKSLSEEHMKQLRKEIETTGFAFPIHVWKSGGCSYIVGGHQRKIVLQAMRNDGWEIPAIPVVFIEAESLQEAKRRVIQDVAQYGTIERQGLFDFMLSSGIDADELISSFKFPDIDLSSFNAEFFSNAEIAIQSKAIGAKELSSESFSSLLHQCPKCGFEFGKGKND